jgi:hypothetical protein
VLRGKTAGERIACLLEGISRAVVEEYSFSDLGWSGEKCLKSLEDGRYF